MKHEFHTKVHSFLDKKLNKSQFVLF